MCGLLHTVASLGGRHYKMGTLPGAPRPAQSEIANHLPTLARVLVLKAGTHCGLFDARWRAIDVEYRLSLVCRTDFIETRKHCRKIFVNPDQEIGTFLRPDTICPK